MVVVFDHTVVHVVPLLETSMPAWSLASTPSQRQNRSSTAVRSLQSSAVVVRYFGVRLLV